MVSITNALGVGAGIDTVALVDQLATAARAPREKALGDAETLNRARISAIGSTRAAIDQFADALAGLFTSDGFSATPTSSVASVASPSLLPGARAVSGATTLTVTQLARAQQTRSATLAAASSPIGQGTLHLTGAGGAATVTIGPGDDSLAGLASAINATDIGVTARVLSDAGGARLIVSGGEGALAAFSISADGLASADLQSFVANMTTTQTATDALVDVDGAALRFTSNRIDNLLPGIRVDLSATGTTRIAVPEPSKGMRDLLGEFVTAYNSLRTALNKATASGTTAGSAGPLAGDSRIRGAMRSLAHVTMTPLGNAGGLSRLSDLGIKTQRDGTLAFDGAKFDKLFAANADGIRALLDPESPGATNPGIAGMLDSIRDSLNATDGPLASAAQSYTAIASNLARARTRLEDQNALLRLQLERQFGAMDRQVSTLNATRSYLDQQIAMWTAERNG